MVGRDRQMLAFTKGVSVSILNAKGVTHEQVKFLLMRSAAVRGQDLNYWIYVEWSEYSSTNLVILRERECIRIRGNC